MEKVRLSDIPGIGAKTEQKLIAYFGSEEEALKALEKQAISLISEAVGSYKKALRLVQNYIAFSHGVEVEEVFGTRTVFEIFKKYLETI
ncbi:MAG TPA: endonuclease MutS2, partial [Pyrodictium sp.]|nr:endonuclease MutS2 [Pyrodictium sp.]